MSPLSCSPTPPKEGAICKEIFFVVPFSMSKASGTSLATQISCVYNTVQLVFHIRWAWRSTSEMLACPETDSRYNVSRFFRSTIYAQRPEKKSNHTPVIRASLFRQPEDQEENDGQDEIDDLVITRLEYSRGGRDPGRFGQTERLPIRVHVSPSWPKWYRCRRQIAN